MDNTTLFFQIFNLSRKSPFLDSLMIFGADYLIFLTLILITGIFFIGRVKEKKAVLLSFLGIIVSLIIIKIIRLFFFEERPFITYHLIPLINHAADASFPSVHTAVMAAIAASFIYFQSKLVPLLIFLLLWIGLGRIYVGLHYPLDILGAVAVGFGSTTLFGFLASKGDALRA